MQEDQGPHWLQPKIIWLTALTKAESLHPPLLQVDSLLSGRFDEQGPLMQTLVAVFIPLPHDAEQADQEDHDP